MPYAVSTLTGTYEAQIGGTAAEGYVEIIPSVKVIKDTAGNVILTGRRKITLDVTGSFSTDLPATDDASLNPTGFGYTIVAKLRHQHLPAVSFYAPGGVTQDVEELTPVDPATFTPDATYVQTVDLEPYALTVDTEPAGTVAAHAADSTAVHGIADTSTLVVTTDPRLSDARTPTSHGHTTAEVVGLDTTLAAKETPAGAQAKADAAEVAANAYTDTTAEPVGLSAETEAVLSATFVGATAIVDAAFGDDLTDAKAHFQSKADALAAAGGGLLHIPGGVYQMSGPLLVPSKVTVQGEGAATVLKAAFTGSGLIYNAGSIGGTTNEDITVTDLCVDGNNTASQGVVFAGVQRGTIHNVRIKRCTGYGVWLWRTGEDIGTGNEGTPSRDVTVSACHITDAMDVGIEFSGCIACTAVGNTVEATVKWGFYIWNGAQDCTVVGNTVVGVGATNDVIGFGVQPNQSGLATPTRRITFTGNTARNVNKGMEVKGYSGRPVYDIVGTGNTFMGLAARGARGVAVFNAQVLRFAFNLVADFYDPINVDAASAGGTPGDSRGIAFDGNVLNNCHSALIYQLDSGSISGNTFNASTNTAVSLYGCKNLTCNNNVFRNTGTSGQIPGFVVVKNGTVESTGCTFVGNKISDDRATKFAGRMAVLGDATDRCVFIGNSSFGAKAGSVAVLNTGTGVNNVIANNIDQP